MKIKPENIVLLNQQHSTAYLTATLGEYLIRHNLRLTTAESCTGGKLASALCAANDTPNFYGVGFVTFTDKAKAKILGVSEHSLAEFTAVSETVVRQMAAGARERAGTDISIAITGYGGPEGGDDGTPAGTVWFGWNISGQPFTAVQQFSGDCEQVLAQSVRFALAQLLLLLP
ncbi:2-oxo-tetronate isomerase [Escherichia fergusonii]|uniref:2-oxo-tetronate isomerase n=1 Tax=Escherichia fergusonii TaxID=564 RepID=UPI001C9B0E95|nr:2-oxo-tetronate isomerase [Escherichia fergusonii]MBY7516835.1 2-oxo-tetronate isomerase [Escherichia fergusonii]